MVHPYIILVTTAKTGGGVLFSGRCPFLASPQNWQIWGMGSPHMRSKVLLMHAGVSIIFKIRVFYKAWSKGFEFFIVWPYAVLHKMRVVFYKKCDFYVFQIFMKHKQCFCQMWSPIQQYTEKSALIWCVASISKLWAPSPWNRLWSS